MSGFLQRLAAQALGIARPVHAASRLPYAPAPSLIEEETVAAVAPRGAAVTTPGEQTDGPPASLVPPRTPAAPAENPGRISGESRPVPAASPLEKTQRAAAREELHLEPAAPAGALRPARPPEAEAVAAVPAPLLPAAAAMTRQAGAAVGSPPPAGETAPAPLPFVERLLPPLPASRRPAPPFAPFSAATPSPTARPPARLAPGDPAFGSGRSAPVEENTEVHLSIGRIEVTALAEAAPAQRPAPPAAKLMTLEEYLARRRGERP